jgi:hypothetical protein
MYASAYFDSNGLRSKARLQKYQFGALLRMLLSLTAIAQGCSKVEMKY